MVLQPAVWGLTIPNSEDPECYKSYTGHQTWMDSLEQHKQTKMDASQQLFTHDSGCLYVAWFAFLNVLYGTEQEGKK